MQTKLYTCAIPIFGGLFILFLWLRASFDTQILNERNCYISSNTSHTEATAQENFYLIKYLIENVLVLPSENKYNLSHPEKQDSSQFKQGLLLKEFFQSKENGSFIEAGAHDGEEFSNSLILERELGWNGLLVEPTSNFFKILQKHRKVHSAHCCFSLTPEPSEQMLRF